MTTPHRFTPLLPCIVAVSVPVAAGSAIPGEQKPAARPDPRQVYALKASHSIACTYTGVFDDDKPRSNQPFYRQLKKYRRRF